MMQKQSKRKIFIHHEGALGDVLLSLPCIRLMREAGTAIHLAARKNVADLLLSAGVVDEISSSDSTRYSSLYLDMPDEALQAFLSTFDCAFIFTVKASSGLAAAVGRTVREAKTIVTIPPRESAMHITDFRLRQCGFSAEEAELLEMFHIPAEEETWAAELLKGRGYRSVRDMLISLHPGSGGKRKCWQLSNYESLISMIAEEPRYFLLLLSGPAEDAETVQMLSGMGTRNERIINLHNGPLIRIATLLARSDFYIGNDSGISHLAGVLRRKGAVLFGPTDPAVWRPFGDTLEVFRFDSETSASVTPEQLFQRIRGIESDMGKNGG
jgi:ADP-heptose:LPS heptosyltransferase